MSLAIYVQENRKWAKLEIPYVIGWDTSSCFFLCSVPFLFSQFGQVKRLMLICRYNSGWVMASLRGTGDCGTHRGVSTWWWLAHQVHCSHLKYIDLKVLLLFFWLFRIQQNNIFSEQFYFDLASSTDSLLEKYTPVQIQTFTRKDAHFVSSKYSVYLKCTHRSIKMHPNIPHIRIMRNVRI